LQGLGQVLGLHLLDFLGRHRRERPGYVALFLRAVAHYHHFVEALGLTLQADIDNRLAGNGYLLGGVAHVGKNERAAPAGGHLQRVAAIGAGARAVVGALEQDRHAGQLFLAIGRRNLARDGNPLRLSLGLRQGRRRAQAGG
nr:hypothetical protein [Tanacetum cinerariifolium]